MSSFYKTPLKPDEIYHFGTKRHSGRYPWGSGDRPYQSEEESKKKYEKKEIARLRTGAEKTGKQLIRVALGVVGGVSVTSASGNIVAGLATFNAIQAATWFTPLGKYHVYFKEDKSRR